MSPRPNLGKPVLLVASQPSTWTSNRTISPNLQESYRRLWGEDYDVFALPHDGDAQEIHAAAKRLAARAPARLAFIDHFPHPAAFLRQYAAALKGRPLPPLFFHLYGDFTLQLKSWQALERLLKGVPVRWICASDRQAALVGGLVRSAPRGVGVCPFPVDSARYDFDAGLRGRARAKFGFTDEDRVLVYSGRFSLQKNSVRLLREAGRFIQTSRRKVHLLLAGSFDDIGAAFFGVRHLPGYYFQLWHQMLRRLPDRVARRVRYLGRLDADGLRELYHASDCYFSLSLHHDEDFGMAPAEAMSCGNAAVLTDWGGYTSFRRASAHCGLIPVSLGPRELRFSSADVQRALKTQSAADASPEERVRRAGRFLSTFSIDSATEDLRRLHHKTPPRFSGFTPLLHRLCATPDRGASFPEGPGKSRLYPRLYRAYYASAPSLREPLATWSPR